MEISQLILGIKFGSLLLFLTRILHRMGVPNPDKYPLLLAIISKFKLFDWVHFLVSFDYICTVFGYGTVATFLSLLYLWQRGYEFFRAENVSIANAINEFKFEINGVVWTCDVITDNSSSSYLPHIFWVKFLKNGTFEFEHLCITVRACSEVKYELKKYILLNIKQ